jgi:hypothetical protein
MKSTALLIVAMLLLSGVAQAQAAKVPLLIPTGWRRAGGLHVGFPVGVSMAIGAQRIAFRGKQANLLDDRRVEFFVVGEPGLGASRVSAGWMYVGYDAFGYGARLSTMWRYHGQHALAVGPEFSAMKFAFLGLRVGFFRRLAGDSPPSFAAADFSFMY